MSLPKLSLSRLRAGEDYDLLADACASWGFFRLMDHGLSEEMLRATLEAMEHFFSAITIRS